MLAVFATGLVSGLAILRHQRRQAAPHTVGWVIFGLLFGVAGWIGYVAHRNWPVLDTCEHCGATGPRDRLECARCSQEFSPPALRGTEVFA